MFLMIIHLLDDLNKFNQKPLSITTLTKSKISSAIHRPLRSIAGNHRVMSSTSREVAENLHHNRDDNELEEYLTEQGFSPPQATAFSSVVRRVLALALACCHSVEITV